MKRIAGIILAVILLFASAAQAADTDLSSMTDDELKALLQDVTEELEKRGCQVGTDAAGDAEGREIAERVLAFFSAWSGNDLDGMLLLCDAGWAERQESPRTALFALLANRTPKSMEEVTLRDEKEGTRIVTVDSMIDRNNGKGPAAYRLNILMRKADDGLWYVDPESLLTYEPADYVPEEGATPEPEPVPQDGETGEAGTQDTVLYYVPEGGEYYHADPNCRRVAEKYLPMRGIFYASELNYDEYRDLKPCEICGAPERDPEQAEPAGFILKIFDRTGLQNLAYLRTDCYAGDEYLGYICSCPDEGEDFYRFPIEAQTPEQLKDLRVELSFGVSALAPEDAILEVMKGSPVEEHRLLTLDFAPEGGKTYVLDLRSYGGDGFRLEPAEAE